MYVIRDILTVMHRLKRNLAYRTSELQRGEPVFSLELDALLRQTLKDGWLTSEVRARWVRAPHMPYCHRVTLEHPHHGTIKVYTGYKSGPHIRADDRRAWSHFMKNNASVFVVFNTDVFTVASM